MKRKARTEMGTFSASAIDLFASALGAFIIITVVLFPYFPNLSPDPLKAIIDQLRSDKAAIEIALSDQKDQNAALTTQNSTLQGQNSTLQGQVQTQTQKLQQQATQIASTQQQLASAQQATNVANAQAQTSMQRANKLAADLQKQLDGAAFIGIEPEYNQIQIVVDYSGSTKQFVSQIDETIRLIVGRLRKDKHSLKIVSFQGDSSSPKFTYWPNKTGFENPLTQAAKGAAIQFVVTRSPDGGTPTLEVMAEVLKSSTPSSIFLITDGEPNGVGSSAEMQSLVRQITNANAGRHQINVIAIGKFIENDYASGISAMATNNGGVLVAIP